MDGLIDLTTPMAPAYSATPDLSPLPGPSLLSPTPNLLNGGDMTATPLSQQPTPPPERFEDTIRDFADVDKTRANIYSRVLAAAQKLQPVSNAKHTLRLVDVDYQDPDKVSLQEQKQAILGRTSRGRRLRGTWELLDNATGEVLDRKKSVLMSVPHMTERGTFIHNGSEYTLKNQQRLRPGVFTRVKDNGEIETHVNVMPGKGVSHRYYLDPDKSVFKLKVGQGTVGLMPLLKTMGATAEQLKEAWGPEMFAANYNADNASEYVKLQSKFLTEAEMQETPDVRSKLLREKFEKTELDPEVTRTTLGGDYSNLNLDALLAISKKLIAVSRAEAEPDDRDSLAYQQFFGPEDLIAERLERDKGHLRRQLLWRASAKGNLRSMPSSALSSQVEAALLTSGLGQCFDDQTWVLTKRGFVRWSEVKDTDLFACRIDGKLAYRRPVRVIREHYEGEMIGCRTKVFSYLVTPNHRCYYRSFQRKGRPQAEYKVATAEALFGKTRCHLTTLVTTLSDRESMSSQDVFTLRWYHDKYKREIEQSVPVSLWAEYLGWWLAEGSAFVDGTQYKSVIAQTRAVNPAECDAIESLLSSLPFNWRLGSNGTDYIIVSKGLCLELRSYGTKRSKRIPRYVFDWPVPLLRKLFDAYMLGDGNDDQGYLKSETVSLGLAHDLVELWGLLGGTAQISPHNTPAGVYWVISYSDAADRYVASSTEAAKHGYDPHFRTYYDGMIYCAEVPGNLLYVMRDGKPHWSHNSIEEINPIELLDKLTAVTRMGEGGIASTDAIPRESRSVQPSMFGYMDPVRTPESGRVGVDNYFARNAKKGRDGKLYATFRDARTGQTVHKTPQEVAGLTVGFPGSLNRTAPRVTAMRGGKMVMVPKEEIDCILPNMEDAFNALTNMVPMKSNVKGQRTVMASRMLTQALPVENAEAPLVQSAVPGSDGQKSFEELYASAAGTVRAKMGGVVQAVSGDGITIRYDDGTTDTKELYNNFPFNRKTSLHQTPLVQPGQRVAADALLAKSNFTDASGTLALGRNARTAYMVWEGKNFEDANVISQSFADKMRSEHIYQHDLDVDAKTSTGKKAFVSLFPAEYSRETLNKFDPTGVIRVGERVEYGEPLILAAKEKESAYNKVHKRGQAGHSNASVTWDHHDPGVVTDVVMGKDGPSVVVKAYSPMRVGDKLSGRYGDKGVIADVIPDHRMPLDSEGRPFEVLLNPAGIITRTNPSQMIELALGKLAAKQGKPIKVPDFDDSKDMSQWAAGMLAQAGLQDTEDVLDPSRDQYVRGIATGNRFFMKLHHTAEGKGQSRGGGGYTAEETPAKGGESGSKRIGVLETNALLSHGAVSTLQDIKNIRGQKNDEYWMQFMAGYNPTVTKVPFVYRKFVNQLKAAGVNVVKSGTQTNIMAMTDKDVDELAGDRELVDSGGVDWEKGLKELRGGLFDKAMTGGHGGDRWAAIKLTEPLPNPAMEEPLRHILRLTNKQFRGVLSGEHSIGSFGTGPTAMKKALEAIDLPKEIERTRAIISGGRKSERDSAIRRLGYLKSAHRLGLHPADYMLKRVPVLPPSFRPVSLMSNDMPLVADANVLYKELMEANKNWDLLQKEVGSDGVGSDRLVVYDAFKAVTGLGDPITQKSQDRNVKGLLKSVFGSSPKYGTVQRKLISTTVDNVGRAVITPNPDLDMDTVGLPEDKAYNAYEKFVTRRLVRQGMPMSQALEAIKERKPVAQKALLEEMETRPVYISRAPVLHKFGIMAFKPVLTKSDTLQVSPLIVKGFNADFDGDTMNYHVPSSDAAREEALTRMLPSKNIFSVADMRSVVHAPANEYVGGLYHATSANNEDRPKKIFQTIADMRKAYARGDVLAGDRVQILEKK